jgi:hypothetical protein
VQWMPKSFAEFIEQREGETARNLIQMLGNLPWNRATMRNSKGMARASAGGRFSTQSVGLQLAGVAQQLVGKNLKSW